MGHGPVSLEISQFCSDRVLEKASATAANLHLCHDLVVNSVVQSWHGWEECRLEDWNVVTDQLLDVTAKEATTDSVDKRCAEKALLE